MQKRLSIIAFLEITLVLLTLRVRTVFFEFFKKHSQIRCTGLLQSSKLVHLDGKNLTCFIQNLVPNLMNVVLKQQEGDKKLLKLKQPTKHHICGIRGLRVNIVI